MKVGIMSMQRVPNNGSFLQSYSLMKNIENMGHEVVFVDYKPGPVLVEKKDDKKNILAVYGEKLKKHICFPKKNTDVWNQELRVFSAWEKEYRKEMMPVLHLPSKPNYDEVVDTLVIGSDEVFNCLQPNPAVGYARNLFGVDINAKKLISYAASFGNTSLSGLKNVGIDSELSEDLKRFDGLSVRDKNSVEVVNKLTGINPEYHVDPVFLYDYLEEIPKEVPLKDYIVVYAYTGRLSQKECGAILAFANKHHKKIVCLAGAQEYLPGFIKTNPFETLAYVKNADYVITDTFHGTVFSIKYNKDFVSIVRSGEGASYGNSNKMEDLLSRFELQNHIIKDMKQLERMLLEKQDYTRANEIILEEKKKSLSYLNRYLSV